MDDDPELLNVHHSDRSGIWWSDQQYLAAQDEIRHLRRKVSDHEEALQLCLMRFKECGAKGHDRVIHMITKLLTKK